MRRKTEHQQRVELLMAGAEQHVPDRPTVPDEKTRLLRARLILEEAMETVEALGFHIRIDYDRFSSPMQLKLKDDRICMFHHGRTSLEEIADGCADVIVVTTGTLSACGIADDSVQCEVDLNNLAKFEHRCPKCDKVLKPNGMPVNEETGDKPGERHCLCCGEVWISGHHDEYRKWVKPSNHPAPRIADVLDHQTEAVEK